MRRWIVRKNTSQSQAAEEREYQAPKLVSLEEEQLSLHPRLGQGLSTPIINQRRKLLHVLQLLNSLPGLYLGYTKSCLSLSARCGGGS